MRRPAPGTSSATGSSGPDGSPRPAAAPADARIRPGAVERNDGVDNQCPGEPGFGLVDENGGASGFLNAANKDEYLWIAQPGAVDYEVARSTLADFSADCTLFVTDETAWIDAAVPGAGQVFHYLNRPSLPNVGSWGDASSGERSFICP